MALKEVDIQGNLLNNSTRLIEIALDANDLAREQNDLLNFIAQNLTGGAPELDSSLTSPGPDTQVNAISRNQFDTSSIVQELSYQSTILSDIVSVLRQGSGGVSPTNPSDGVIKEVASKPKESQSLIKTILLLGGAFLVLGLGLKKLADIDMTSFMMISNGLALIFLTLSSLGNADLDIVDIIMFDMFINTMSKSFVNMSQILQNMAPVSLNTMVTLGLLSAAIIPIYSALAKIESELSIGDSIGLLLYGMTFPKIARAMVATAQEVAEFPENFKMASIIGMIGLSVALLPFVYGATRLFEATRPLMAQTGLDSILRRTSLDGGKLSVGLVGKATGPGYYMSTLFRMGATFVMLPLLAMTMLATAAMFSAYVKAGGMFEAPPVLWAISVGIAMTLFSSAVTQILFALDPKIVTNIEKTSKKGSSFKKNRVSESNVPGALAVMGALAIGMIVTAGILAFFPSNPVAPDTKWAMNVGLALLLFSMALKRIISATRNEGSSLSRSKDSNIGGVSKSVGLNLNLGMGTSLLYMVSMAFSIVLVARILKLFPKNPVAPSVAWVLGVGLAMVTFAKAYQLIATVTTKSKGFFKKEKSSSIKGALGGVMVLNLMALSIVSVAYIMELMPSDPKSPPLGWTLQAGLAMIVFAKAVGTILRSKQTGGLLRRSQKQNVNVFKTLTSIAFAIVATAYIFKLLPTEYNAPPIWWALQAGLAVAVFTVPIAMMTKAKGSQRVRKAFEKDKSKSSAIVTQIALTALAIVAVAFIFQLLPPESAFKAPPIVWTLEAGLAIALFTASLVLFIKHIGQKFSVKNLIAVSIMTITAATIIVMVSLIFQALPSSERAPDFIWTIKTSFAIVAIGAALAIIGKFGVKNIMKGATSMLFIGVGIAALSIGIKIWNDTVSGNAGTTMINLLLLAATFVVMGLLAFIVGKFASSNVYKGILVLALVGIPIIVLAYAMQEWNKAITSPKDYLINLGLLALTLVGLGAVMAIAGIPVVAGLIILGSIALMIAGAALIVISKGIGSFAKNIDTDSNLFELSDQEGMFGRKMTNFEVMMNAIAHGFAINPITLALMTLSMPAFIGAGIALNLIGKSLKEFQDLDLNAVALATIVIPQVLNAITDSFAEIGRKNDMGFIKGVFIKGPVAAGIDAVKGAGKVLSEIATGLAAFSEMKFTDKDGKPIHFSGGLTRVSDNIVTVMMTLGRAFAKVGLLNKKDYGFAGGNVLGMAMTKMFTSGPVADGINATQGMGIILSEVSTGLMAFANMKFTDKDGNPIDFSSGLDKVKDNIVTVMTTLGRAFAKVGLLNKKDYGFAGGNVLGMAMIDMFKDGPVADGINATAGMGKILTEVASGLVSFANMKFTDKDGKPIEITPDVLTAVTTNIVTVMTAVGEVFAKIGEDYNAGGFMGFFGAKQVERGVDAVKGLGTELVNIVSAVKDIASFTFTDENGETVTLNEDMLRYIPGEPWSKQGTVVRNIAMVVGAVAAVFAEIGKQEDDSFFFPSKFVQKGVEAVKGMGTEMVSIVKALTASVEALKATDSIDEPTLDAYNKKVPLIIGIIPKAVIKSILEMQEAVGDPKVAFNLVTTSTDKIAKAIEKIAKYEKPIEKVATSLASISDSMVTMSDAIDNLDGAKLEKMNTMFTQIKDIAYPPGGAPVQDIPGQIAAGIKSGIIQATEKTQTLVEKLEKIQKENTNIQKKIVEASGADGKASASAEFMLDMFTNLELKLEELNKTMGKVATNLTHTLSVKNEETGIINGR